jgi:3D-(3,5/4)-trihydroxycyclohexane-1,2-dione acylhydrolase (decyclizing)
VLGAVNRAMPRDGIVVCAAGGLPGELHKLWRATDAASYHLEYGYSCMGYEIAGGLGVKLAAPEREVVVMVGDGSYLMMNSEIATSVALGAKLTIVVLDNRGFGCINRLQRGTGGEPFNNLLPDAAPRVDFAAHARAWARRRRRSRHRGAGSRAAQGASREAHAGARHRHRSAGRHRRGRRLVGRAGQRRAAPRPRRPARRDYEANRKRQAAGA